MLICGIKLTHDSSIALIDDSKLIFSYELEKINNNNRHTHLTIGVEGLFQLLRERGYESNDIDRIVFDGWHIEAGKDFIHENTNLRLAGYGTYNDGDLLSESEFYVDAFPNTCKSYKHVSGHVFSAYCSSPFASRNEDSFIMTWDGGMFPQLFYYNHEKNSVSNIADLFKLTCGIYNRFGFAFAQMGVFNADYFSITGKMMAFASLGTVNAELSEFFKTEIASSHPSSSRPLLYEIEVNDAKFIADLKISRLLEKFTPEDLIATFQDALGKILIQSLREVCGRYPKHKRNLCYSGGSALNITWNAAIRNSGLFEAVWIPPFANDAGSALGAACCEMVKYTDHRALEWNVYQGPPIINGRISSDWEKHPCSIAQLAGVLHRFGEPVVFLNEGAELGPRALGNRSIIAPAVDATMKHYLNVIKDREFYRPVAPLCIEEDAPAIFDPGTPDPYMLFTHKLREEWKKVVPAICHVDGTARLQTIRRDQNPRVYELLVEYKKLSGISLLCNTSANLKGKGFFPDVATAIHWGKANLIWNDGYLFTRKGYSHSLYDLPRL
jgi:carbamoyltransferase